MKILIDKESWDELKNKLKDKYPYLENADLKYKSDEQDELMKMVAYKLRKTRKELQDIIMRL